VADLSAPGERRDAALAALRSILAAGLRRAFQKLGSEPPLENGKVVSERFYTAA